MIDRTKTTAYANDPLLFLGDLMIPGVDGPVRFKEAWAPFQVEAFKRLVPTLKAIAMGRRPLLRGTWLERTKGASKDSDVGFMLLWLLAFARTALRIELGANKQDQAAETKKAIADILRLNPWLGERIQVREKWITCKATDSRLDVLTSEAPGTHGSRPHVSVCNELSHIQQREFAETMLDNADKLPNNFMVIATNAGLLRSWQWDWREIYRDDSEWYFQKVDEPAPWIPERNIENARKRNSATRFRRLWNGVWSSGEGDALDHVDIMAASTLKGPMEINEIVGQDPPWFFAAGIDMGVRHDHAGLVVLGARWGTSRIRLCRCQSWKPGPGGRVDTLAVHKAILQANEDFGGLVAVDFDPDQMEHMAQELEQQGVFMNPVRFVPANCDVMARDLLMAFRERILDLYPDYELIEDLHRLSIVERKFGTYKLEAVRDERGHADRATAFAIVLPRMVQMCEMEWDGEDAADRPPERIVV